MVIDLIQRRQELRKQMMTAAWEVLEGLQDELTEVDAKIKHGVLYEPMF